MMARRLAAALLVTVSLAGCSAKNDAKADLAASTKGLTAGNYRYQAVMATAQVDGVMDLAHKAAQWTTAYKEGDVRIEMRVLGNDEYTLKQPANVWQHIDLSRVPDTANKPKFDNPDRTEAGKLLALVQSAERDGDVISGKLDTSNLLFVDTPLVAVQPQLTGLIDYAATVDGEGQLSKLELQLPAAGKTAAGTWTLTVSDYGTAPAPQVPTPAKDVSDDYY